MVVPFPNDFFVTSDLEDMGPPALLSAEKITDDDIAIFEGLDTGDPGEVQFRRVPVSKLPHSLFAGCHFDHAFLRAAGGLLAVAAPRAILRRLPRPP